MQCQIGKLLWQTIFDDDDDDVVDNSSASTEKQCFL